MATVWLARDLRYERPVALKVLHSELAYALGPERFQREIMLAARLQHPHILSVYDSGESAGRLWFTMPYVEGQSLRARLGGGPLPAGEAVRIAREAAQALQYAHDHGVIHRDIKPENILLTRDGSTLVADFGIARTLGGTPNPRLTAAGLVVGTPSYMSPEQAAGESAVDGRSDIYSLGCVLHEMLTGRPPFSGPTAQAIITKHLTQAPPPLPGPLSGAVGKALAKSPAERFASAADFAAALGKPEPEVVLAGRSRALPAVLIGLGLLAASLVFLSVRRAPAGAAAGAVASGFDRKLAQLTFGEGLEEWPSWSPDGGRLAYTAEADGYRQLFLRTLATEGERRISNGRKDDIQPAWSPDGALLSFVRAKTDRGKLEPNDINGWYQEGGDIWTVELAGGREARLIEDAFGPAYSPDGARLAFDAPWAGPRRIWIADARGRNPRQVTSDSSEAVVHTGARWSPDGSKLAFRRIVKNRSDIVVAHLASQELIRVTDDNVLDADPIWSPDARYLYFASLRGGGLNVWRIRVGADGRPAGQPIQLTTGAGDDVQPALAPTGQRLAFAVRGIHSDLWRLPVSPETGRPSGEPGSVVVTTRRAGAPGRLTAGASRSTPTAWER